MNTISILEVENALNLLSFEVETSKGVELLELVRQYVAQQRERQIKEKTLIIE